MDSNVMDQAGNGPLLSGRDLERRLSALESRLAAIEGRAVRDAKAHRPGMPGRLRKDGKAIRLPDASRNEISRAANMALLALAEGGNKKAARRGGPKRKG
jgi:hypothetical protein